ncbi:hypothetical protein BN2364_1378 [Alloalcanivorax xenomutans]|nr:hypothetical protein BN2364_1378 [Alloalcanivorax xenomutans]
MCPDYAPPHQDRTPGVFRRRRRSCILCHRDRHFPRQA